MTKEVVAEDVIQNEEAVAETKPRRKREPKEVPAKTEDQVRKNIYEKLLDIQLSLKAPKNQFNETFNFYYRNTENIQEALKPYLESTKTVLHISHSLVCEGCGHPYIKVSVKLVDLENPSEFVETTSFAKDAPIKNLYGFQSTGLAISAATKYCLNALFLLDDTRDAKTLGGFPERPVEDKKASFKVTEDTPKFEPKPVEKVEEKPVEKTPEPVKAEEPKKEFMNAPVEAPKEVPTAEPEKKETEKPVEKSVEKAPEPVKKPEGGVTSKFAKTPSIPKIPSYKPASANSKSLGAEIAKMSANPEE